MLTPDLRRLVRSTTEHARRWNDDDAHTVAGGLLTRSGLIVLGMDTHHLLGGVCSESAALSQHASIAPEDLVVAIAAVHGPTGEVIAPCGTCRQVLIDASAEILCVVREPGGLTARTVRELLPVAHDDRGEEDRPQRLHMWRGYETAIRTGAKRQTIRVDDPFRPGPAVLVIEDEDGEDRCLAAAITGVRTTSIGELTALDARRDGFDSLEGLRTALDGHYPGLAASDPVDIVTFALTPGPVTLRPFAENDRGFFASLAMDPRVVRFVGDGTPWSSEHIARRVQQALSEPPVSEEGAVRWFIARRDDERVGLFSASRHRDEVEIGYWVAPSSWGRGVAGALMEEGLRAVDEVFGPLPAVARIDPSNAASIRLAERHRFRRAPGDDSAAGTDRFLRTA